MRFPDDDGLPLWLFILVILLTTGTIALIAFVVWRKCIRRSSRPEPFSLNISNPTTYRAAVQNGHSIRSSQVSPTVRKYCLGPSRRQGRQVSHQWPETAYFGQPEEEGEKSGYRYAVRDVSSLEEPPDRSQRRSWSDAFRRQSNAHIRSGGWLDDEEDRASYVSDSVDVIPSPIDPRSDARLSNTEQPWLDSPAPLSPMTPLTLPRTPHSPSSYPTTLQFLSRYAAVPPLPAAYLVSRYREGTISGRRTGRRDSRRRESRFSSSQYTPSPSHEGRSSVTTRESFLNAWAGAYHGWLASPETPSSSSNPAKTCMTTISRINAVSITDSETEHSEEHERDVSPPSSTPILSTSPISRSHSFGTISSSSGRKEGAKAFAKGSRNRQDQISWLVDN